MSNKINEIQIFVDQILKDEIERLQARITELESKQRWIPISSGRLPNKFQECIVLDSSGHVHNWIHDDVLLPLFAQYTHWMPLPEPPIVYGKVCEE